jgi:hypothetical protein
MTNTTRFVVRDYVLTIESSEERASLEVRPIMSDSGFSIPLDVETIGSLIATLDLARKLVKE